MKTLNSSDVMPGYALHRLDDKECSKGLAECRVGVGTSALESRSNTFTMTGSVVRARAKDIRARVATRVPTQAQVARARAEVTSRPGSINDAPIVDGLNNQIRGI